MTAIEVQTLSVPNSPAVAPAKAPRGRWLGTLLYGRNVDRTAKARAPAPLNVFIDREGIQCWADALTLEVIDLRFGGDQIVPEGVLGQSICVLRKVA